MIVHPSPPAGSALRQRMIEDMTVRGFTAKTQHDDIRCVKTFAAFLGRSPTEPSAAGLFRSTELAGSGDPGRKAGIIRSSTAASLPARASRVLATRRRLTSNAPNAFIRP
ncbi:hypothetical protein [Microvirga calopogonii]|uniref:hypothetical protein n=1 Tax=Microvirga calopogonii TaxID=2078013 RepID=UPI00197BFF48|nr:hypothetical protein [Microvirga calopogonii]